MGERHLFIRFEECHIHCEYCDELDKAGVSMSLDQLMEDVKRLDKEEGPHRFISLTGGEPLLYLPFLKSLMPRLKAGSFKLYLETNGILWHALEEVIGWCDVIAMDMKPSSVTKEKNFDEDHRRFLKTARSKETFIKIVLSKEIDIREFEAQIQIVAETAPETPVLLMPVSGAREGHEDPDLMQLLYHLQRLASHRLRDVRISPRLHKILGIH